MGAAGIGGREALGWVGGRVNGGECTSAPSLSIPVFPLALHPTCLARGCVPCGGFLCHAAAPQRHRTQHFACRSRDGVVMSVGGGGLRPPTTVDRSRLLIHPPPTERRRSPPPPPPSSSYHPPLLSRWPTPPLPSTHLRSAASPCSSIALEHRRYTSHATNAASASKKKATIPFARSESRVWREGGVGGGRGRGENRGKWWAGCGRAREGVGRGTRALPRTHLGSAVLTQPVRHLAVTLRTHKAVRALVARPARRVASLTDSWVGTLQHHGALRRRAPVPALHVHVTHGRPLIVAVSTGRTFTARESITLVIQVVVCDARITTGGPIADRGEERIRRRACQLLRRPRLVRVVPLGSSYGCAGAGARVGPWLAPCARLCACIRKRARIAWNSRPL